MSSIPKQFTRSSQGVVQRSDAPESSQKAAKIIMKEASWDERFQE
jgi:hypothetical protein